MSKLFTNATLVLPDRLLEGGWLLEDGGIRDFKCGYSKYRSILEHEAMQKQPEPAAPKVKKEKPEKKRRALFAKKGKIRREAAEQPT